MSQIIKSGVEYEDSLFKKLHMLSCFEEVIERPVIQRELIQLYMELIDLFALELKEVFNIFMDGLESIRRGEAISDLYISHCPVAGTLHWCKALRDRLEESRVPIHQLLTLRNLDEYEAWVEVSRQYKSLHRSIREMENERILIWEKDIKESISYNLSKKLLRLSPKGVFELNLDPALIVSYR